MKKNLFLVLGIIGTFFVLLPKVHAYCLVSSEDNNPLNVAGFPYAVLERYNAGTLEESLCTNAPGSYDRSLFFNQSIRFATSEAGYPGNNVNEIALRGTIIFDNPVVNVAVGNWPLVMPPDEAYAYNYPPFYDDPTEGLSRDDYGIVTILAGRTNGNFSSDELPFRCASGTKQTILRNLIINTYDITKDELYNDSRTSCLRDGGAVYVCPGIIANRTRSHSHPADVGSWCDSDNDGDLDNDDCAPADPDINSDATEACDGVDNNCNGRTDEDFGTSTCGVGACRVTVNNCEGGVEQTCTPGDSEAEVCDGVDNDCDGRTDEGGVCVPDEADADDDGYCVDANGNGVCDGLPAGTLPGDCNDRDDSINPGETETCDGIDNNCAGGIDEGCPGPGERDDDGDGYCEHPTACGDGTLPGDCDDREDTVYPGADEICDGMDNDCDELTDEEDDDVIGVTTWYQDMDGDDFGNPDVAETHCEAPLGYVGNDDDCNDGNLDINPAAVEVCDGVDNNCNGGVDEGDVCDSGEIDNDGDGYCEDEDDNGVCDDGTTPGDCNDANPAINPDADEICDRVDNDCDGLVDDSDRGRIGGSMWYEDFDGDTFGNHDASVARCNRPIGFVSDDTDCRDTNAAINPAAIEVCGDGVDNDCDGVSDEVPTWYEDADGDTFGNPASTVEECDAPPGYVADNTDCNDENGDINPRETEVCGDGIDNDCDDILEEGATWYRDADGDRFGNPAVSVDACDHPEGYVDDNTDCDDGVITINPAAIEICADNMDNDCDEFVDEGCIENPVIDDDKDGYCEDSVSCDDGSLPSDCDDSDPSIHPGAAPDCNDSGIDADCDGTPDINQPICQETPPDETDFRANLEGGASGWNCSLTISAFNDALSQMYLFLLFLIPMGIFGAIRFRKK